MSLESPSIQNPAVRTEPSGFILLDKPAGITSFQALFPVKKVFKTRRVGHAGTLDQEASGLIVVAVGKCTRLLHFIESQDKHYRFQLHLGKTTETLEWPGEVTSEDSQGARTGNALEVSLRHFLGAIEQVPPVYSAIKINGNRASDLARKGVDVSMKSRQVMIHALDLAEYGCFVSPEPRTEFHLTCHCSKGTYIRSLARDIATDLGTVGCASGIRRTAIGSISVDQAVAPNLLTVDHLLSPKALLPWPVLRVDASGLGRLLQGNWLPWDGSETQGMAFVADSAGTLRIAVEWIDQKLVPKFHLE